GRGGPEAHLPVDKGNWCDQFPQRGRQGLAAKKAGSHSSSRGQSMSVTIVEQAPTRLNRSELAVPGSNPKLFKKAAESDADVVFLDLEDAVAPDDKEQARKNVIKALNEIDWGNKTMSVRINGLDTHYMYRDVIDVIEQAVERLDVSMDP